MRGVFRAPPLARYTLAASVGRVLDLFDPVVRHIQERALSSAFVALDATSLPVLDAAHPLGLRSASLWLLEGDHRSAHFFEAPSGYGNHLDARLRGYRLASVLCDGSATNNGCRRGLPTSPRAAHASRRPPGPSGAVGAGADGSAGVSAARRRRGRP